MVPEAGIEPARPNGREILSLLRLPIPPFGHRHLKRTNRKLIKIWRLESESNRRTRSCSPLHDHSAIQPYQD